MKGVAFLCSNFILLFFSFIYTVYKTGGRDCVTV